MAARRENIYNKVGRTGTGGGKEGILLFSFSESRDKRRRCKEPQLN